MNKEPVAITGGLTAIVNALIACAVGFQWVHWTPEQIALAVGLWNAVVAFILILVVRNKVTPT